MFRHIDELAESIKPTLAVFSAAPSALRFFPDLGLNVRQDRSHGRIFGRFKTQSPLDDQPSSRRLAGLDEPSGRFGHEEEEETLNAGRDGAESHDPAPPGEGVPILGEQPSDYIRDHLTKGDGEIVHGNKPASVRRGGELGNVHGRHETGSSDPGTDDRPSQDHRRDCVTPSLCNGAEDEE